MSAPTRTPAAWRVALSRVLRRPAVRLALAALGVLALLALLAPLIAPFDPTAQQDIVGLKSLPPSARHPFGTDPFSRDVLSRMLHGARVSLSVAFLAVALSATIGTLYGAVAGLAGGRVDGVMMRIIDACLAIPRILLLLAIIALWGRVSLPVLILLLGTTGWFGVSRLVRAEALAAARREYVVAARALGASGLHVLVRHVLPNVLSPVIVAATLGVGGVIVLEAGLSFLGLGVQPPHASWGNIIQDGSGDVARLWWMAVFPGAAIVVTVLACNVLGDALRDALDPRQLPGTND